jgi:hypothetical protein
MCRLPVRAAVLASRVSRRPRWSASFGSRRILCSCAGASRRPDGVWISDWYAFSLRNQHRPYALVLGNQRRCRRSGCKHCRCHEHCPQHRHNTQDRSRLLSSGRGSRRVVGVRGRAAQPRRPTIPAPKQSRECVEVWLLGRVYEVVPHFSPGPRHLGQSLRACTKIVSICRGTLFFHSIYENVAIERHRYGSDRPRSRSPCR